MSIRQMSDESGVSVSQCRTAIKNLKTTGEIDLDTSNKKTIITIINYDVYQGKEVKPLNVNTTHKIPNETWKKSVMNDPIYLEQACMKMRVTKDEYETVLNAFVDELAIKDLSYRTRKDFLMYFGNWLRYNNVKDIIKNKKVLRYTYSWNGMPVKKGNQAEYDRDKRNYDHPGFDFKLISVQE